MKPLVIYHANCADGFGAAFAAWLKLGEEAEYLPMQYGQSEFQTAVNSWAGREIYVLDFSFSRETMNWLFANAKRVVWLDHHKTAFEAFNAPNPWIVEDDKRYIRLDNEASGAMLAWEYFHPDKEVPMLIRHIDDYDRWQFKIEGTKEFQKALWSYAPWSFEQWKTQFAWLCACDSTYAGYLNEGAAILRAHEANVQAVVKGTSKLCWIKAGGYPLYGGLAANCPPHLASDVGHALATQSGTYGLLWYINKENKCLCSLRSNGDYDVSAIAKAFGGGGHKNAAGFEVPISILLDWIK